MSCRAVVHIFADSIDDKVGGLERSVRRIAGYFQRGLADRVVLYCRKLGTTPGVEGCECVDMGAARSRLAAPLIGQGVGIARDERFRLDGLLLRSALENQLRREGRSQHVIISFFATTCGFVAQTVCSLLGLPHICCVRGSDFSRGAKTPEGLYALEFSSRRAQVVVTTSDEQRRFIESCLNASASVQTIYNACELQPNGPFWQPRCRPELHVISDTGCSYKKGTHLCLEAFKACRQTGLALRLTVTGNVKQAESGFWTEQLRELEGDAAFAFVGHLSPDKLCRRLLVSDLYVSASLGEGCPNSVLTVLGLGLPAVLPACGAIPELAAGMPNVWLFSPGSASELQDRLTEACSRLRAGEVVVDTEALKRFRTRFSEPAEIRAWGAALNRALQGMTVEPDFIGRTDATAAGEVERGADSQVGVAVAQARNSSHW
jgi:glycosyltransferase involved in cell wall biosynthesis